jgi:hypothetical protein
MGFLAAAAAGAVVLAGCYSPSLRDCTVTCTAESDCAAGQVCGDDGLCAGPDLAGHCNAPAPAPDAGPGPRPDAAIPVDAGPAIDAAPPPDAPAFVTLRIQIDGKGSVFVDGRLGCSSMGPQKGDCSYDIARGVAQTIRAFAIQPDQPFSSWTSVTCRGTNAVCTITPTESVVVVAKFGKSGGPRSPESPESAGSPGSAGSQ